MSPVNRNATGRTRVLTDDHSAHDHCGCCGNCYVWLASEFCTPCRSRVKHLGPHGLPPWDRTYEAVHGSPCPFQVTP